MRPFNANKVALSGLAILFFSQVASAASAVLGIDLGQEFIKAALVKPGIPLEIVLTKDSKRKEAAVVGFKPPHHPPADGEFPYADRLYGGDALAVAPRFPHDTYPNLKQLLGLDIKSKDIEAYSKRYPALEILPAPVSNTIAFKSKFAPAKEGETGVWSVEELLAMQLENVKKNAELMAGKGWKIKDAVIAIPAYFTVEEREALKNAAELAGLKILAFIGDGVAVGVNYAMTRQFPIEDKPQHHIIYDMGAGSTTASLLQIKGKTVKDVGKYMKNIIEVSLMSVGYNRKLGGDAFTEKVVELLLEDFANSPKGKKLNEDPEAVKTMVRSNGRSASKLWKEATRVRHILSANSEAIGGIESFVEDIDFRSQKILRSQFEEVLKDEFYEQITLPVRHCLAVTNLEVKDIDSVILHGGAIRTPYVVKALEDVVGAEKIAKNVNSDEAAVLGATFHGAGLSNSFKVKEIRAKDSFEFPIFVEYSHEGKIKKTKEMVFQGKDHLGSEKTVTLKRITDFEFRTYHTALPPPGFMYPQPSYISLITTKNLTDSTTKLKEQYNCTDADILTKATLKIGETNGIPKITAVWAECEALVPVEVKKVGIVDGVKNFLGLNKDKKDTKTDSKSSTKSDSSSAESSSTASESAESAAPATGEKDQKVLDKKDEEPKLEKKTVKIPVRFKTAKAGIPQLPKEEAAFLTEKLANYTKYDSDKTAREEARNVLEAFIYKARSLLEDVDFTAASTKEELATLSEKLTHAMDWLYEDGANAAVQVVKDKLEEVKKLESPISYRKDEASKRPELIKQLKEALESGRGMIHMMKNPMKPETPEGSATPSDASAMPVVDTSKISDALKEEMVKLETAYAEIENWMTDVLKKQELLKPHEEPVFSSTVVGEKLAELNKWVYELFQKQMAEVREQTEKLEREKEAQRKAEKAAKKAAEKASTESESATSSASAKSEEKTQSVKDEL